MINEEFILGNWVKSWILWRFLYKNDGVCGDFYVFLEDIIKRDMIMEVGKKRING
jgi:hypothetical protein